MVYSIISVLFLLHLTLAAPPLHPPPALPPPPSPPLTNFAVLALQWSEGLCMTTTCNKIPSLSDFTVHGVWFKDHKGDDVKNCPVLSYNKNLMTPLMGDMVTFWPSFLKLDHDFWDHEWIDHGTCSQQLQETFFHNTLNLAKIWCPKIKDGLDGSGVSPSPTQLYVIQKFLVGIESALGRPQILYQIKCSMKRNKKYLVEVRVCLDKNLQRLLDCPKQAANNLAGCGTVNDKALLYTP